MASTLDYASPVSPDRRAAVMRPRSSIPLLLACLYLPYSWILVIDYPWGEYRLLWLKLWPILPGLLAGVMVGSSEVARFGVMGLSTAVVLALFLLVFRRPRHVVLVILVSAAVFVLSGLNAWVAYALFRM